jgi:hypothetical protein|tara:strand:- start:3495 stop:3719 length:225 start_codon:yes stop_codon:yes gene_type:complete
MRVKVALVQEQKTIPDNCNYLRMNTIKEVYDWVMVKGGVYHYFYSGDWVPDDWATKNITPNIDKSLNFIKVSEG